MSPTAILPAGHRLEKAKKNAKVMWAGEVCHLIAVKSDNVPALVRARFVTMMVLLFIPTTLSPPSVCVTVRLGAWI